MKLKPILIEVSTGFVSIYNFYKMPNIMSYAHACNLTIFVNYYNNNVHIDEIWRFITVVYSLVFCLGGGLIFCELASFEKLNIKKYFKKLINGLNILKISFLHKRFT